MYLMFYYIHVDNLPIRRSKIAISCWTWLSDHVRGITDLVFMQNLPLWRMNMNHIVASPGCLKHAKGGRICIFLPWPWVFSNCNSSLYCSELLCFWLVSLLIILYLLSKLRDTGFGHWNWNIPTFMDDRLKKSLPEKYQKRTETSILTAVLSASLATLTCYPLDTAKTDAIEGHTL